MKRTLLTGVRQPGSDEFQFTVYGPTDVALPPAEFQMTLKEFSQWIDHTRTPMKGGKQLPLLSVVSSKGRSPKPRH